MAIFPFPAILRSHKIAIFLFGRSYGATQQLFSASVDPTEPQNRHFPPP